MPLPTPAQRIEFGEHTKHPTSPDPPDCQGSWWFDCGLTEFYRRAAAKKDWGRYGRLIGTGAIPVDESTRRIRPDLLPEPQPKPLPAGLSRVPA